MWGLISKRAEQIALSSFGPQLVHCLNDIECAQIHVRGLCTCMYLNLVINVDEKVLRMNQDLYRWIICKFRDICLKFDIIYNGAYLSSTLTHDIYLSNKRYVKEDNDSSL